VLLVWYRLLHPDVADILKLFVPALPLGLLIAGGLIFSMVNAAVEEGAYRGVIFHALDTSLGTGFAALLLQALAFGAIHIRGFPRGWLGVGLACIYGLFMGVIRRRAAGMFAPWIAHVFTDLVIVAILLVMARPEKPNQALQGMIQSLPLIGLSASDPCRTAPAGSIRWPLPVLALIHSHTRSPSGLPVYVTAGQSVPFSPPV
jgi:membrane protease YdiL (CAAX protease family)